MHSTNIVSDPFIFQTNGMVERFNGRISETLATHHFDSRFDLTQTQQRYVYLYNYQIPQRNLNYKTPIATPKSWKDILPHLFTKQFNNYPGRDSFPKAPLHCIYPLDYGTFWQGTSVALRHLQGFQLVPHAFLS
jgi:hypothetical protein